LPSTLCAGARAAIAAVAALLLFAVSAHASQTAGIQTHVLWSDVSQDEMERQFDLVKESGAGMTRVDVGWASLQERGPESFESYHLQRLDRVVDAAEERGIKLLLTLMNTPCWASSAPASEKQSCAGSWWERDVTRYAPTDPSDYARALAFLVDRYEDRVAAWEIWNEPNHSAFWAASDPARAYAALVKAAYPAAKAAYPGATIVAGSLSQSDYGFAQRLYDNGIRGSFDAFSIHPYSDDVSPADERRYTEARYSFARGVPAVRDVMVRNDDRARPLWLTESGWSTSNVRGLAAYVNGVSESDQARFLREQAALIEDWSYVEVTIWFNLVDRGDDRSSQWDNCGLRRVNGTAKPAWASFREAARALASDEEPAAPDEGGPAPGGPPSGGAPGGGTPPSPPGGGTPTAPPGGSPSPGPGGSPAPDTKPKHGKKRRKRARHKARAAKRRAAARRTAARRRAARRAAARNRA
jgi:hypothetical protein